MKWEDNRIKAAEGALDNAKVRIFSCVTRVKCALSFVHYLRNLDVPIYCTP
jgi:hypothetical protein